MLLFGVRIISNLVTKVVRMRQGLKSLAAFKISHDSHNMLEDRTSRLPLLATTNTSSDIYAIRKHYIN